MLPKRSRHLLARGLIGFCIFLGLSGCGKYPASSPTASALTGTVAPSLSPPLQSTATFTPNNTPTGTYVAPSTPPNIQPLARLGQGRITTLAWSPVDAELSVATTLGIRVMNTQNWEETAFIDTQAGLESISYSPDGKLLASVDSRLRVRLWNRQTGQLVRELIRPDSDYSNANVIFSPEGRWLAVATGEKVYLLDSKTGQTVSLWNFNTIGTSTHTVTFSPDGQLLAAAGSNEQGHVIRVWETKSGKALYTFDNGVMDNVWAVTFSPDSRRIIGGSNHYTRLWDVVAGRQLETDVEGPLRLITAMSIDPQGNWLALSDDCGRVRLDSFHYSPAIILQENCLTVSSQTRTLAFSPDGQTLALSPNNNAVRLWKLGDTTEPQVINGNAHIYQAPVFYPDREALHVLDGDGNAFEWNWGTGQLTPLRETQGNCEALSVDHKLCARANARNDQVIGVWDQLTQQKLFSFESELELHSLALSPDGTQLAVGEDSVVSLWNIKRKQRLYTLRGHTDGVWEVIFSANGRWLASAGGAHDGTVRVWDATSGKLERTVGGGAPIAFSAEGFLLTTGGYENTAVHLWDLEKKDSAWALREITGGVPALAINPKNSLVAVGLNLWDLTRGEVVYTLTGSTRSISSLVFNSLGDTLAANSSDGIIYVWKVKAPS